MIDVEQRIRDALACEVNPEPTSIPAWDEIRDPSRRARRRRRLVLAIAVAIVGIGAPALVTMGDQQTGFVDEFGRPRGAGVQVIDDAVGYSIEVPDGWVAVQEPGDLTTFWPGRSDQISEGDRLRAPASLAISPEPFREYTDWIEERAGDEESLRAMSIEATYADTEVGGRRAVRADLRDLRSTSSFARDGLGRPFAARTVWYVDWYDGWVLTIVYDAIAVDGHRRYGDEADAMVEGIRPLDTVDEEPLGTFDSLIRIDEETFAVKAFLDARVRGGGAEQWIGLEVTGADLGWAYSIESGPRADDPSWDIVAYSVDRRRDLGNGRIEYTVRLHTEDASRFGQETFIFGLGRDMQGLQRDHVMLTREALVGRLIP